EELDSDTHGVRFTLDAMYHLSKNGWGAFSPYLALGTGVNIYDVALDHGEGDPFFGAGFGTFVDLSRDWFLKADYRANMIDIDTEVNHATLLSVGYRWGGRDRSMDETSSTARG